MAPDWKRLYTLHDNKEVNVRKVDCTNPESKELCEQLSTRGYPTIYLFEKGMYYEFKEYREFEQFREFSVKGGYKKTKDENKGEIPERLFGAAKYKRKAKGVVTDLQREIDRFCDSTQYLQALPHPARYLLAAMVLVTPGFFMFYNTMQTVNQLTEEMKQKKN